MVLQNLLYLQHINQINGFMKKFLLLLVVVLFTNAAIAESFEPTYLGSLAVLTLDLDADLPNRVELEVPRPSFNITSASNMYGPGQPRIESVGSTIVFSLNTKILRLDIGEQAGNVIYELPVDKWYHPLLNSYTTSWLEANYGNGGWKQCYYEISVYINVTRKE